jgi:hypothetical protein
MKKTQIVTVKMSENDYEKLKIISGDKGVSECIRTLVDQAYRGVKEDTKVFQNFERMTEVMTQLTDRLSVQKSGYDTGHFQAIIETLKILGTLIIALPDKRKIFTDEIERIESELRGDMS